MTDSRRFEFHIPNELDDRIKVWRSRHPDLPNRSEAARLLLQRGLEADTPAPEAAGSPVEKMTPVPTTMVWRDAPWNAAAVKADRTVACNSRINERLDAQMKWLLAQTGRAKRELIEAALSQYLRDEIEKRGIKA